jgi:condensin complex subunit 3
MLSAIQFSEPKSLTDPQVLVSLALIYLSPDTADNQELRQCLSYFFPVYSYSAPAHQRLMQKVSESFDSLSSRPHDFAQTRSFYPCSIN